MLIGVPKEIKSQESRVGLTPASARELTSRGHQVWVEAGAGSAIGLPDEDYVAAGATLCGTAKEIFSQADLIVKVKEPQPGEIAMLRPGQILYTYLHLAPDPRQAAGLIESGAVCIAYETITCEDGSGVTDPLPAGTYTLSVDAFTSAGAVGTAAPIPNGTIQDHNHITDLGTVNIPIDGL